MLSTLVFFTFMPLQVSPTGKSAVLLSRPLAVAAYVDTSKILGLPKFKLRDGNGNPYMPEKILLQEPLAMIYDSAGIIFSSEVNKRKAYIQSYVRR